MSKAHRTLQPNAITKESDAATLQIYVVALLASISNFVVSLNIILIKYMSSLTNPLIETTVADEPEQ